MLAFIPQPQEIQERKGCFAIPAKSSIGISEQALYPLVMEARRLLPGAAVHIIHPAFPDTLTLKIGSGFKPGGYSLSIDKTGIVLSADSVSAAFHGLQTLRQAASQAPADKLPLLTITDWPDFPDRGIYYDVCRGRVPKLERLMELADLMAKHKLNQLQLYIEHTFAFRGHPDIGKGCSPLTAEDILKLDAYCLARHIELVPSLASFGHMNTVLNHPQYRELSEDRGISEFLDPQTPEDIRTKGLKAWTLSPGNPKAYDFIESLYAEFLPLFSSRCFNVCCDETYDLGYGQSYELCRKLGRGRLYLGHIVKLNELSRKYGKKMMFWGDIVRHYPDLIPEIPKDVTVLDWGYDHNHAFAKIEDFKKAGLEFYACPSASSYYTLFPRLPTAMANIAGFVAAAKQNGAQGILNTEWGDGGHYNFMECSWHGFLFGAEQSWNTHADQRNFTERFGRVFLGSRDRRLAKAIAELGEIAQTSMNGYYQSIWRHIFFAGHAALTQEERDTWIARKGAIRRIKMKLTPKFGMQTFKRLEAIRPIIAAQVGKNGVDPAAVLSYWLFAIDTLRHAARKLALMGPGRNPTTAERATLQKELVALRSRFRKLWLARNRSSNIEITLAQYDQARAAIRQGSIFQPNVADIVRLQSTREQMKKETGFVPATDILLSACDFQGGGGPQVYGNRCEQRPATWVYGAKSAHPVMSATFKVKPLPPCGDYQLVISAQDNDKGKPCCIQIKVNDTVIFEGDNPFIRNGWSRQSFTVPGAVLMPRSVLAIRNLEASQNESGCPFFMLNYVVLKQAAK